MAELKGSVSKPPTAATVTPATRSGSGGGGGTPTPGKFPQWGIRPSDSTIIEATDSKAKIEDIKKGYVEWFDTRQKAENALSGMKGPFGTGSIPNPFSWTGAIAHWIGDAVLHLTDGAMWRSLGWIALGAILVIAGIYLWFRTSATYKDLESSITGTIKAL